jgi:hypothetical protein
VLRWSLIVGLVLLAGCHENEITCTAIGCSDSVIVQLPEFERNVTVEICAGGRCETTSGQGAVGVGMGLQGRTADMTVTVRNGAGMVVARGRGTAPVTVFKPNGDGCPPECRQVRVTLQGTSLVPTPG